MNDVTAKRILKELAVLARDIGVYVICLGKHIYITLRSSLDKETDKTDCRDRA